MTPPSSPALGALPSPPRWPAWRRFLLNMGTLYLGLYFLVGGQSLVPVLDGLRFGAADAFHGQLFGSSLPPRVLTGSGDTAFDWTSCLLVFLLALVGGILWTLLRRHGPSAVHLSWLETGLRAALVLWLGAYSLAKFNFGQFGLLGPGQLTATYGDSSPMGLLWRFMAASPGYQYVAGVAEVLPALLLLHRRTVTVGALIACVTITNVFALNLFYDVPVKLFSFHLLLAALILLALDHARLHAFVAGRPLLTSTALPARRRWQGIGSWVMTALLLGAVLLNTVNGLPKLREWREEVSRTGDLLRTRGFHPISETPFNR